MFRVAGHAGEAAAAWFLYVCFSILPVDTASALGGWIGRTFGSRLSVSNNARRNLKSTYPDWSDHQVETIVISMWNNLGRTAGEHPHLSQFNPYQKNSRVEVVGFENCEKFLRANTPCLFFSGHIANWEISPLAAKGLGLIMHLVYRRANNPFFDKLVQKGRNVLEGDFYPKGSDGAKGLLRSLKKGANVAMLVDQKMNDGISVPFLGRNAMTAPALAELALRYKCPIIPARVERLQGAHFRLTLLPPLQIQNSGNKGADILKIMTEVNVLLGDWISEKPEQWLWVHNRWPD